MKVASKESKQAVISIIAIYVNTISHPRHRLRGQGQPVNSALMWRSDSVDMLLCYAAVEVCRLILRPWPLTPITTLENTCLPSTRLAACVSRYTIHLESGIPVQQTASLVAITTLYVVTCTRRGDNRWFTSD